MFSSWGLGSSSDSDARLIEYSYVRQIAAGPNKRAGGGWGARGQPAGGKCCYTS